MRLIKPKVELIKQESGVEGLFKHMELCARTCYKSEDKITEDSAKKFINNVIVARGHTAMLEHGTVYLHKHVDYTDYDNLQEIADEWFRKYLYDEYSIACSSDNCKKQAIDIYVTTNYRVLLQNDWLGDLQYLCSPTDHYKRITVRFICDMGVAREFCRHRVFSFAQESTRYCNYAKDKFGKECTFIIPCWANLGEGHYNDGIKLTEFAEQYANLDTPEGVLICNLIGTELDYFSLLNKGWTAQQARNVLPLALKTELIMTGTAMQWIEFLKLRCATDAHPQARELAVQLRDRLLLENYIDIDEEGNLQVPNRHKKTEARSS